MDLIDEDIGLLIIGYDRPNLLKNRISELSSTYIRNIYISIDGGPKSHTLIMHEALAYAKTNLKYMNLTINHHDENQGAVNHIVNEISKVLSMHKFIIYLDDDIKLSTNFYKNIVSGLNYLNNNDLKGIVTGHSRIFGKKFANKWREVNMAYPQGCAFSAEVWNGYTKNIHQPDLQLALSQSKKWANLSNLQKKFWLTKFINVSNHPSHTWDYQFTYHAFIKDLTIIAPIFAIVGNEGYGYDSALHTKGKKPRAIRNDKLNEKVISDVSRFSTIYAFFELDGFYLRFKNRLVKDFMSIFNKSKIKSIKF